MVTKYLWRAAWFVSLLVFLWAALELITPEANAHADQGSYLAAAHAEPTLRGTNDLWLMAVGAEVCAGRVLPYGPSADAVTRIAHQELCP